MTRDFLRVVVLRGLSRMKGNAYHRARKMSWPSGYEHRAAVYERMLKPLDAAYVRVHAGEHPKKLLIGLRRVVTTKTTLERQALERMIEHATAPADDD